MEYHSQQDRANRMVERTMELVLIQVDSAKDELEHLAMLIGEIENEKLRDKMDKYVDKAMRYLDQI
ncbi:hypothetical protein [Bacillus sp. FJAT-22090]|uniref:hypothetical protein n=1 Tax=Bacillus sp. FJAT-22090 TaxID=1581038 RepID=UPI0011A5F0A8|nr:hypothetical protein [Bacillus sp. FJAT-22090]